MSGFSILADVKKAFDDNLQGTVELTGAVLGSTALQVTTIASLKNVTYVFAEQMDIKVEFNDYLSTRFNHFEAGMVSLVNLVYSFAVSLFYTLLTGVTFGQVESFRGEFKKHWIQTALAIPCLLTNAIGIVTPKFASYATGLILFGSGAFVIKMAGDESKEGLWDALGKVWEDHVGELAEFIRDKIGDNKRLNDKLSQMTGGQVTAVSGLFQGLQEE